MAHAKTAPWSAAGAPSDLPLTAAYPYLAITTQLAVIAGHGPLFEPPLRLSPFPSRASGSSTASAESCFERYSVSWICLSTSLHA